jgi:hypothetical protein
MSRALREARMSLAQAVTRSLDASDTSDAAGRAAVGHRHAAAQRLRRAGREELAARLGDDTVTDASARATMREVMQLVDAALELDGEALTDGGRQATERRKCVTCGSPMRVVPDSGITRCLPCRRGDEQ